MDESAFFMVPKGDRVIARRGSKAVYKVVNGDEKESLTVLFSVNGEGEMLPPLILFWYERVPLNVSSSVPGDWYYGTTETGWMTGEAFFNFIKNKFYPWLIKNQIEFPVILYLDGHKSHISLQLSLFCRENRIHLAGLYPNATHILQPLDVAVFSPLKKKWKKCVNDWRMDRGFERLSKDQFAPLLQKTINSMPNLSTTIKNGFLTCGLSPFNPSAVNYSIFNKKGQGEKPNKQLLTPLQVNPITSETMKQKTTGHLQYFEQQLCAKVLATFKTSFEEGILELAGSQQAVYAIWLKMKQSIGENFNNNKKSIQGLDKENEEALPADPAYFFAETRGSGVWQIKNQRRCASAFASQTCFRAHPKLMMAMEQSKRKLQTEESSTSFIPTNATCEIDGIAHEIVESNSFENYGRFDRALKLFQMISGAVFTRSGPINTISSYSDKSYKIGCPAFIKLELNDTKEYLVITDCNLNHLFHDGSEANAKWIVENRRLNELEKMEVKNYIKLGVDVNKIQELMMKSTGKAILKKDIFNVYPLVRGSLSNSNSIGDVERLLQDLGAYYKLMTFTAKDANQEEEVFQALYIGTEEMQANLRNFPEIVFFDSTYNLSSNDFVLSFLAVMNAYGQTELVGIGILIDETSETLKIFLEAFKEHHAETLKSVKIRSFMTDKAMSERVVLKELFPEANLYLCDFHVLQIFNRTITKCKMDISQQQRIMILKILLKMVYCESEKTFTNLYQQLLETKCTNVIEYFNRNWKNNTHEWVRLHTSENNLLNYTNNRLESLNAQVKKYFVKDRQSFTSLITGIFNYIKSVKVNHEAHQYFKNFKKSNKSMCAFQEEICQKLTPYASKLICSEHDRHFHLTVIRYADNIHFIAKENFELQVTSENCTCDFYKALALPCRHIMHIRKIKNLPLFDWESIHKKWFKHYYIKEDVKIKASVDCVADIISSTKASQNTIPNQCLALPIEKRVKIKCEKLGNLIINSATCKEKELVLDKVIEAFEAESKVDVKSLTKNFFDLPTTQENILDEKKNHKKRKLNS